MYCVSELYILNLFYISRQITAFGTCFVLRIKAVHFEPALHFTSKVLHLEPALHFVSELYILNLLYISHQIFAFGTCLTLRVTVVYNGASVFLYFGVVCWIPAFALSLILRLSRTGTVSFYTSTSNRRAAQPKLYTESLTRDLKLIYSRLTLVRISIKL